ncbi:MULTISPECIES: methyl-accepting chemotaxis protein [unclassified Neptuniibacter]|uniref:methyl-accepting chemotaxis protein n=1 Tax=unclassified Neptuniibacter TaxID=2630693 RepID=UPI000C4F18D3|nr:MULTISPECIES: methyl-accepting chemotaxis protein [unclassified Neptuniibacter]MAY42897.1 methyl-accepting chemotaxis protein [Oceanospirillaceae bacterium]
MQSFWEFKNVRIPIKFAIALGLLCVGLVFMGASYYQTIVLQEEAKQRSQQLNNFLLLVSDIQANVSEARFQEKSFQVAREMDQLSMYNDVMATVETDISSLQGYLRTDEDKELVQQFQSIMDQYQDTFYDASETSIQIGLSKGDEGLASEIRTLIAETEPLVLWLNRNWVRDQLEILQINIDDYIAHDGKTVELEIIQEDLYKIQKQIETAHLDSSKVKSLSASRESAGNNIIKITALVAELAEAIDRKEAQFANLQSIIDKLSPKIEQVTALAGSYKIKNDQLLVDDTTEMATYFFISMAFMIVALAISMSIVKFGVTDPLSRVQNTIDRVREGEVDARCELDSKDELGQLSGVLDSMLEEKESALQVKEEENKRLNASIISLIQNVFQISQRDLTVRVPVAEDVTGAISDSINQLVTSIESVLQEVSSVSGRVNSASVQVKSQSETVLSYAEREKEEIGQTLDGLDSAIKAMELISKLAVISNNASQKAIKTSETAMDSVSQTIDSINKIRQTIHEAEKRIKRLGERSQEIGGIVNLINNISERTHVLSLNASMHAASAGEAGRGLMVVVDEVQRLSENSREATSEIESLVNNIQLETADTINVINNVITDVVEGTRLAEEAGERMGETRTTTQTLVDSVVRIAHSSVKQAKVAEDLRTRANSINETTQATNAEMRQQTELSDELVDAAEELQRSVSVFKLATS